MASVRFSFNLTRNTLRTLRRRPQCYSMKYLPRRGLGSISPISVGGGRGDRVDCGDCGDVMNQRNDGVGRNVSAGVSGNCSSFRPISSISSATNICNSNRIHGSNTINAINAIQDRRNKAFMCDLRKAVGHRRQSSMSTSAAASFNENAIPLSSSKTELSEEEVMEIINKYSKKKPTSATLETLVKTGKGELLSKTNHSRGGAEWGGDGCGLTGNEISSMSEEERVLIQIANFLRRELPIRLARGFQALHSTTYLREMPSVKKVLEVYKDAVLRLSSGPPIHTMEQEAEFAHTLEECYEKASNVLLQMAKGAFDLREKVRKGEVIMDDRICHLPTDMSEPAREFEQMQHCHKFLDKFYMSRIGIRVIAGQYLALRQQRLHDHVDPADPNNDYVGIICKTTSPRNVVHHAADDATWICQRRFGDAPEVIVTGGVGFTFPYIPTHLHYILLELLKNAMRATMEKYHGEGGEFTDSDVDIPPIHVVIADGKENEDVVIKVSDEGGGIPRSHMTRIWSYLFTTASPSVQERLIAFGDGSESSGDESNGNTMQDHSIHSPLAGLGYGLPISRSYARYFGGDLSIMSMEGYGTDCFLHLRRLGNSKEPIPV